MAKISPKYNLEYFVRGSTYSSGSDYRRFATIDYNLESYIGILGNGVISGWEITDVSGTTIKIMAGEGFINGFSAESPYKIIRRSQMDMGQREIEIIRFDELPEPYLNSEHKNYYVDIIKDYNPSYDPPARIEDVYVKVVEPYQIVLPNNKDCYIYAKLPSNHVPYPSLTDDTYTSFGSLQEPKLSSYAVFSDYLAAKTAYEEELTRYRAYQWKIYEENHFTEVEYEYLYSASSDSSKILLGVVKTRNNDILSIDRSDVETIKNLESGIKRIAKNLLSKHIHGGNKEYDPPKIKLETDYRNCKLLTYDPISQSANYKILDKNRTNVENGHSHSFIIDAEGSGRTVDLFGESSNHYHLIENYELEETDGHIHSITNSETYIDGWEETSDFVLKLNDIEIADQDSTNITLDFENKEINLSNGARIQYSTYYVSFQSYGKNYYFEAKSFSAYEFLTAMISDYKSKYSEEIEADKANSAITEPIDNEELKLQSIAVDANINKSGDKFQLRSPISTIIQVVLKEDKVPSGDLKLEILENSEVTGELSVENITFINASKFLSGEFKIERIPFISHLGRIKEKLISQEAAAKTSNGYKFNIYPYYTTKTNNHYHNLKINSTFDGKTNQTLNQNKELLYIDNVFVSHVHNLTGGTIESSDTTGAHIHELESITPHNSKIIYSVTEDSNGNIYMGTSSGLLMVPIDIAWRITIDENQIYVIQDDIISAANQAAKFYKIYYNKTIDFSNYEEELEEIEDDLETDGAGILIPIPQSKSLTANVLFEKITTINISAKTETIKFAFEVNEDDFVKEVVLINNQTNETVSPDYLNLRELIESNYIDIKVLTEQKILTPVWNLSVTERLSNGTDDFYVFNGNTSTEDLILTSCDSSFVGWELTNDPNKNCKSIQTGNIGKPILATHKEQNNNLWILSKNEINVIRNYQIDNVPELIIPQTFSAEYFGLVPCGNTIMIAASNGIIKTNNQGSTWQFVLESEHEIKNIVRDYSLDKTNFKEHNHGLDVNVLGNGTTTTSSEYPYHVHVVENWVIAEGDAHEHEIVSLFWAVNSNNDLLKSSDNGSTWTVVSELPYSNFGEIYAFNGYVFVAFENGIWKFKSKWEKISDKKAYSFGHSFDFDKFYIGCLNELLEFDGETITTTKEFGGNGQGLINDSALGVFENGINKNICTKEIRDLTGHNIYWNNDVAQARNGSFASKYDIFNDGVKVYSSYDGTDLRETSFPWFQIDETNGEIIFKKTTILANAANFGDNKISVKDASGLYASDCLYIYLEKSNENDFTIDDIGSDISDIALKINEVAEDSVTNPQSTIDEFDAIQTAVNVIRSDVKSLQNKTKNLYKKETANYQFVQISEVSGNDIYLTTNLLSSFPVNGKISKISPINNDFNLEIDVLKSKITNSGANTHKEIDDKLSNIFNDMPHGLSQTFMSNILQLAQATKYAYPDADSEFKQSKFYDFHYSENENETNWVGNYVDVTLSELNTSNVYFTNFGIGSASKINHILLGYGSFNNKIFVSTDIGLFWANYNDTKDQNWWFAKELKFECFVSAIYKDEKIIVGTSKGLYSSTDLETWTAESNIPSGFIVKDISYRWDDKSSITVDASNLSLSNIDTNTGKIAGFNQFGNLSVGKTIKITATDNEDIDGFYFVSFASPDEIKVSPALPIDNVATETSIEIIQSNWWSEFDKANNTIGPNLNNPLLLSGINGIYQSTRGSLDIWQNCDVQMEKDWEVKQMSPLKNGNIIGVFNNLNNLSSGLVSSKNNGTIWSNLFSFSKIEATILHKEITTDGFVKLTIDHPVLLPNGFLKLRDVLFGSRRTQIAWNEVESGLINLYLAETSFYDTINVKEDKINILPPIINYVHEFGEKIIVGSELGLLQDYSNSTGNNHFSARFFGFYDQGTIKSIGLSGNTTSVYSNKEKLVEIVVKSSGESTFKDQYKNGNVYFPTLKKSYTVQENSSKGINDEISVVLAVNFDESYMELNNQLITLLEPETKIKITFDNELKINQFQNGTFIVANSSSLDTSNLEYKSFKIIKNGKDWVSISSPNLASDELFNGNVIILVDENRHLRIMASYNQLVENYQLNEQKLSWKIIRESEEDNQNMEIINNYDNIISLKIPYLNIEKIAETMIIGDVFFIKGSRLLPIQGFNNKMASISSDHYHDVNLVGEKLSGDITSLQISGDTATIYLENTSGFNNSLILLNPTMLSDEKCKISNVRNLRKIYFKKIKYIGPNYVEIFVENENDWNEDGYSSNLISENWNIEIDARFHGVTSGTYYKLFTVINRKILSDAQLGEKELAIDSSGMSAGDYVVIYDNKNGSEINEIESVDSPTSITLKSNFGIEYLTKNLAHLEVKRNSFSNTHSHNVKKGKIESVRIQDYVNLGYNVYHNHYLNPYVENVQGICENNEEIVVCGNSDKIYGSSDLDSWNIKVNLDLITEKDDVIENISFLEVDNQNGLVAGASSNKYSYIFVEKFQYSPADPIQYL